MESGAESVLLLQSAVSATGPFPADGLRRLVRDLALELAVLHARGQAYGQLSPMTVGISTGGARLLPPAPGTLADTAGYLAPEAAAGQPVGPAADLFALGAVTVFAGTGTGPFGPGAPLELLRRVLESEPDLSGVPEDLRDVLGQCMSKDPARRPLAAQVAILLEPRATAVAPAQPPPSAPDVSPVAPSDDVDRVADPEPTAALADTEGQQELPDAQTAAKHPDAEGHKEVPAEVPVAGTDDERPSDGGHEDPASDEISSPPGSSAAEQADPVDDKESASSPPGSPAQVPDDEPDSADEGESPFGPPIARLELPSKQDFSVGIETAFPATQSEAADAAQGRRAQPAARSDSGDSAKARPKTSPPAPEHPTKKTAPKQRSSKRLAIAAMVAAVVLLVGAITVVAVVGLTKDATESAVAPAPPGSSTTTTPAAPPGPPRIAVAGVTDLVVAPDGRRIYAAVRTEKTVAVIDTASNTVSATIPVPGEPDKLTITPDGAFLYVATKDAVATIDTKSDKVLGQINGPVGLPRGIGVAPDNNRVYVSYAAYETAAGRAWLAVLDPRAVVPTGTVSAGPAALSYMGPVVLAPNGRTVYAGADRATDLFSPKAHVVLVADTTANAVTAEIPVREVVDQLASSPDGRLLFVTHKDNYVTVIDTARNAVVAEAKVDSYTLDVAIAPNGRFAFAAGNAGFSEGGQGTVQVMDTATNAVVETFKLPLNANVITVTPDGRRAYVGNSVAGGVLVLDISRYA